MLPRPDQRKPIIVRPAQRRYELAKVRVAPGEYKYGVWDRTLRYWDADPTLSKPRAEILVQKKNGRVY